MRGWLLGSLGICCVAVHPGCVPSSEVTALKSELATSNQSIETLKQEFANLKTKVELQETIERFNQIAYLTPGEKGYSTLRGDMGAVTVSLVDIKPYANGSEVSLTFGNTTYTTLNNNTVKVEWGRVDEKGVPKNESARTRQHSVDTLRPGAWTTSKVVLEGVPPQELGFVRVSELKTTNIQLLR